MPGPLDGIRILDITRGMPGAVASVLLADYGADVISVRRPDAPGDWSAGTTATWDRCRRLLVADLAADEGAVRVRELVAGADVVLVGLSPDSVERFALGPDEVTAADPQLVYVAMSGFGLDDRRPTPGFDALAAAELGAMVTAPGHRDGPVFLGHPALSYSTAFVAVIGTLAALRARVLWGRGDVVDVSLQDGVLAQLTMNWWSEKRVSFMRSRTRAGGLDMGHTRMLLRRFRCADGALIQVHTGAAGAFGRLMKVLGLDGEISPASGPVESACPLTDGDLAVLERTPELFAGRAASAWLDELWANEIAALPVQQPGEVFDDPQVRHNGLMRTLDHPELGRVEVVGPPIHLARTPALELLVASRPLRPDEGWVAPGLGRGAGADPTARSRPPLDGVRVVEFASFFAAPYANRFLSDLGADVVKVEPTSGDPIRSLPDPFEGASRGKRSIAVDVKHDDAVPLIGRLLAGADIVQHNLRPGAAERLGIDDASVRALNPGVIYDYAPGYGSTGPKCRLQSFAPLHSGFVGIHAEAAGAGNEPMPTFGNEDYYNGQLNAIASLLALVHKARTGEGQYVECSQLSSSVFVTSHWYRRDGVSRSTLPRLDAGQTGWSPHVRIYQCLEGWVCVCCVTDAQRAALEVVVLGHPGGAADDVAARLQDELYGAVATEWITRLRTAGVPSAVVRERHFVHDFLRDPGSISSGRATAFTHHDVGEVRAIARIVQLRSLPPRPDTRAPTLGEHTAEIAGSGGLDPADIDRLAAAGALRLAED